MNTLSPRVRSILVVTVALLALVLVAPLLLAPLAAAKLRGAARARGLEASWTSLRVTLPARAEVTGLVLVRAGADTVLVSRELSATLRPLDLLLLRAHIAKLVLADARIRLRASVAADVDTTLSPDDVPRGTGPASPRVRNLALLLVRAALLPARELPELTLTDVVVERNVFPRDSAGARERAGTGVHLDGLALRREPGGVQLAAAGEFELEQQVPFDVQLHWAHDDRLTGRAEFRFRDESGADDPLTLMVDGRLAQDRRAGIVRLAEGTRVRVGEMPMRVSAEVRRDGPRFSLALSLDSLTSERVQRSLPRSMLGPLTDLDVRGSWDWHAAVVLDVSQPDSTRFSADVIPHGLQLVPGSRLPLLSLNQPFTAHIHLPPPRGSHGPGPIVTRELSPANPHFRPLDRISPSLRFGVLTNEDGGFYRHRGFNTEAIQLAIAANLRAGAYKRGAGTITMQLARNLFLGHRRTLSRKGQEVALAWVLEHLAAVPKDRLLEIYLNIIEWGPSVHGADEAARYYFNVDAAELTLAEALFLTIIVPSPAKWRWRLDSSGQLRPFARAQMHYIGNKMIAKGWLDPAVLPPADELRIELRGPAGELFAPADQTPQ